MSRIPKALLRDKYLILMVLPAIALLVLFHYIPIYGIVTAFQNYTAAGGFFGSKWVGLKHFRAFVQDPYTLTITVNTITLNLCCLAFTFPAPIILAIFFNEMRGVGYKRVCQTVTYMPNFISVVIVVGLVKEFTAYDTGAVNELLAFLGMERINFLFKPFWFVFWYVFSKAWQGTGFGTILYLAALSNVNVELYDSARIDGANRMQKILHIDLPSILPTIVLLLIFAMGGLLGSDFQRILLLYNELTYSVADVLSTYTYRKGLLGAQFSYGSAVGLMTSLVSLLFLSVSNAIARRASEYSLW